MAQETAIEIATGKGSGTGKMTTVMITDLDAGTTAEAGRGRLMTTAERRNPDVVTTPRTETDAIAVIEAATDAIAAVTAETRTASADNAATVQITRTRESQGRNDHRHHTANALLDEAPT